MDRPRPWTVALLLWLMMASWAVAQSDPLGAIPDNALGFGVIRDIGDANARIGKLTEKMQLPVPDVLTLAKGLLGVDKGLDEKGGIAVAVVPLDEDEADAKKDAEEDDDEDEDDVTMVFVVPVTDYKEFVGQLDAKDSEGGISEASLAGQDVLVAKKGNFALIGDSDQKEAFEKFVAASKSVVSVVEPLRTWLQTQQLAIVVTPAGKTWLLEKLEDLLPDAEDVAETEGKDTEVSPTTANLLAAAEMFKSLKGLLDAADKETTHLAAGIRIDDDAALHIAGKVVFKPDGNLAGWARGVKAPEAGLLAGLPTGKFALAYGAVSTGFSPEVAAIIRKFTDIGLEQLGLSAEDRAKAAAATQRVEKNKLSTAGLLGMTRPGDSIVASALSIERVKDSSEHIKATRELLEIMQGSPKNKQADGSIYDVKEVQVGDLKALQVTTDVLAAASQASGGDEAPAPMQGFFAKLFGEDGKMVMFIAAADDHTVVSAYSKDQLQRGVAHVRSGAKGLETDEEIAKTAKLLPAGAQWAAYINPQGLIQWIDTLLANLFPPEANFHLPSFAATEPIGAAARVSDTALDAELVLPGSVVAGLGQFIMAVGQMFGGDAAVPLP